MYLFDVVFCLKQELLLEPLAFLVPGPTDTAQTCTPQEFKNTAAMGVQSAEQKFKTLLHKSTSGVSKARTGAWGNAARAPMMLRRPGAPVMSPPGWAEAAHRNRPCGPKA